MSFVRLGASPPVAISHHYAVEYRPIEYTKGYIPCL